jgi:isopentenyldiphosphate isomerase
MPLFICRWQNGDFSAVSAASKIEAIALLDEVGNAEVCELFTVKHFMVHFSLKQETNEVDDFVPVDLEEFGEETVGTLSERV